MIIEAIIKSKTYCIVGIIDKRIKKGQRVLNIPVLGNDALLKKYFGLGIKQCFIAIGSVGDSSARTKLAARVKKIGFVCPNIVHPRAIVSSFIRIGSGNFIGAEAILNAGAVIGNNCIINTAAIVEHDCKIGNFVHISPGVILSGGVSIADKTHIGTGAVVIQGVRIGKNSIVGAGSVVVGDLGDNLTAYGNPCRKANEC